MSKQSMNERRQAERSKRVLSIQYRLVKSKGEKVEHGKWYLSTTYDMSALGIAFLSESSYHVDDILELQVVMSGALDIFKGFGRVVRVEKEKKEDKFLIALEYTDKKDKKS